MGKKLWTFGPRKEVKKMAATSKGGQALNPLADLERVDPIRPPSVSYPKDFTLWDLDVPKDDRVRIVNEQDFPLNDLLSSLGLSDSPLRPSFGTANYGELLGRSGVVAFS